MVLLAAVEVGNGEVTAGVFAVGDALSDGLVRSSRVVVHLVLGQDGTQMVFPWDQHTPVLAENFIWAGELGSRC